MQKILDEINLENGSNYKKAVLKKYKDNELLKKLLKMTYDKTAFTYGITMKNVHTGSSENTNSLEWALDLLQNELATRKITGNAAIGTVENILEAMSEADAEIIKKVLDRDLKLNLGRTTINEVFKGLIVKIPYCRCDIGTKQNIIKNINFNEKVYSQIKMDGTYRACTITDDIIFTSRSGKEDEFYILKEQIKKLNLKDCVLIGELTLKDITNRSAGNGLINSDNPPHNDIVYTVWDIIPIHEYTMSKEDIKIAEKQEIMTKYEDRLSMLEKTFKDGTDNLQVIDYKIVHSAREAFEHFQEVTKQGLEGTVIKAHDMTWKPNISKKQLKVKLVIDADVRCISFIEGKKGTKREKTFGSIVFENDEGTIKGSTSGFTDKQLQEINENRESYTGRVFTVEFNDVTKGKNSEYYALSHPRFKAFRDKNETDTLKRCLEMKEMAMNLA